MLRNLVFVVLLGVAIWGAFISPFGALLAYLWFALFRPLEWIWIDLSALRLSLLFGVVLLARSVAARSWPNVSHRTSILTMVFLLSAILAHINAVSPETSWHWIDYFVRLAIVCMLLITQADSPRRLFLALFVVACSLGFYSVKAGFASLTGGGVRFGDGLAGGLADNNAFALAAVMIMPFFFALTQGIPENWKFQKAFTWIMRISIPLSGFAAVSMFSRSALLAMAAGAFMALIVFVKRRFGTLMLCVLVGGLAAPFVPLPQGYKERVQTIYTYQEVGEESAISRLHFWKVALHMVGDKPLGIGMFNFNATYDKYDFLDGRFGHNRSVHNSHLQVLAEQGFIGFIAWIWLYISSLRICFRIRKLAISQPEGTPHARFFWAISGAFAVSMVSFLIGGSFIAMALNEISWITFALVAAMEQVALKTFAGAPVKRRVNPYAALQQPQPTQPTEPSAAATPATPAVSRKGR